MTERERMIAVLAGEIPDRIPWVPRLEMWYKAHQKAGTLPDKYYGWDLRSIYRDQHVGFPGKWGVAFRTQITGAETVTRQKGDETRIETITPVGSVYTVRRRTDELAAQGIGAMEVEHMIKAPQDYDVLAWIYQHTEVLPTYEEYMAFDMECRDEGIPQVNTPWTPAGYLFGQLIGWNQCYYHLYDYPDHVSNLLGVMTAFYWDIHRVCAESPALVVQHGAHFHSTMTPPHVFKQYYLPYLQSVSAYYHQHGKLLQFHGDADISGLEELILAAGYDIAECMVTAPMVKVTLRRLREVWGSKIVIWGGIPSIILADPYTEDDFRAYMDELLETIAPGNAFILGVADMVVPATKWERFESILSMVESRGACPIHMH